MQPRDAGSPSDWYSLVPCTYSSGPKFSFTRPIGFDGPGGSACLPRAQLLSGGCHHGFQMTSRIRYSPRGVSYPFSPTDTAYSRVRTPFSYTYRRFAGTFTTRR